MKLRVGYENRFFSFRTRSLIWAMTEGRSHSAVRSLIREKVRRLFYNKEMGAITPLGIAMCFFSVSIPLLALEYQLIKKVMEIDRKAYERDFPEQYHAQQLFFKNVKLKGKEVYQQISERGELGSRLL